jgi:hypothetical protein
MTTATEKKANATEQQSALSKLAIPHVNPKQVDKAVKALEKVADKGKAVSADKPQPVKIVNSSFSGTNGAKVKPKGMGLSPSHGKVLSETVEEAVGRIKMDPPRFGLANGPWGGLELKYYSKEELAAMKTPWVMVKGVLIEPKQTGIKEAGRISTDSGHTFWLNMPRALYREKEEPRVFSHYVIESDGITVQLLLDEKSSVQINSFDIYRGGYQAMDINRHMVNQAVLTNTDSTHDTFLGEVILENQSTNSCVFNSSTVSSQPRFDQQQAPWVVQRNRESPRQVLKYSSLSRSSVFNSVISDSIQLLDTTIDDSNIKTNEGFSAANSRLKEATIKGHRARLKFAQLEKTYIPSTGSILIVNTIMKDESLGDKPLYVPNKFCTLKVDLPHDHLSMRRETLTKVGITVGYRQPVDIEIDATMDVIDAKVREVLRDSSYHNPLDPDMKDPVVSNLIHYVVQAIRSRLRVIKMLDSAVRTARVVTGEAFRDESEYGDFSYQRPF